MKPANVKITTTASLHALIFIVVLLVFIKFYTAPIGGSQFVFDIISLLVFSASFYIVLWRKLYSKELHVYLKGAFSISIISVNLILFFFIVLELGFSFLPFTNKLIKIDVYRIFYKYLIAGGSILMFVGMQFLWILYLSRLGIFYKKSLIFGLYDERIPLSDLFQDLYGTKECKGQVINHSGVWLHRINAEDDFKPINAGIYDYLRINKINELILCITPYISADDLTDIAAHCQEHRIGYYLISDIRMLPHHFPWNKTFETIPVVERYCPNQDSLIMVSLKRVFDIIASSLGLILLSPVFLIISFAIAKTDGLPIVYKSTRIGIHGRPMKFFKFRTMVKNAEALKAELLKYNERPDGPLFKMEDDPRVTRLGQLLRKTSLDELPQLWNVLKGDMSLIGPRPHLPEEVKEYQSYDHLRLECMPGISCLPQIMGRDNLGFRDWVNLDLEYRKRWTFLYDFKILWQTARVVLSPILHKNKG